MTKLLAIVKKEWLLLLRDFAGLLIIFILPMALVLFLSLTQSKSINNDVKVNLLVASQSNTKITDDIVKGLAKIDNFVITKSSSQNLSLIQAKQAVADGKYQGLLLIPTHIDRDITQFAQNLRAEKQSNLAQQTLLVWFDPTLSEQIKNNIELSLQLVISKLNQSFKDGVYNQIFPNARLSVAHQFLTLQTSYAGSQATLPNAVQQNVPAWAIFGMFFIVIPLAGVMVRERQSGVMQRLQIAPVSAINLLLGKIIAFTMINLIQLWLMILEGVYILPTFGLPALVISGHLTAIWVIGICTALAATGFGILIGAFARTNEQASIVAPFLVVIAAAIGGILVPVFVMPDVMQRIVDYSPLNWSLQAFLDVFVKQASVIDIKHYLVKLLIFFAVVIIIAALRMRSSKARITGN